VASVPVILHWSITTRYLPQQEADKLDVVTVQHPAKAVEDQPDIRQESN
jgi:hypothetical protein